MADFGDSGRFRGFSGRQRNATGRVVRGMRTLRNTLVLFAFGWLAACGGGGEDAVAPPAIPIPDPFIDVDRAAERSLCGAGHFRHGPGYLRRERRQALREDVRHLLGRPARGDRIVIENGRGPGVDAPRRPGISDAGSTTGAVLGWTGPQGAITLRQLLSFTSGLEREAPCTLLAGITLADCVAIDFPAAAGGGARHAVRLWQHASARGGAHGGGGHRRDVGEPLCHAIEDAAGAHFAGPRVVHRAAPGGGDFESARRGRHSRHDE